MDGKEVKKPSLIGGLSSAAFRMFEEDERKRRADRPSESATDVMRPDQYLAARVANAGFSMDEMLAGIRTMVDAGGRQQTEQAERIVKARTLYGMKVVVSPLVGPDEVAFLVGDNVMARIINLSTENGAEDAGGGKSGT